MTYVKRTVQLDAARWSTTADASSVTGTVTITPLRRRAQDGQVMLPARVPGTLGDTLELPALGVDVGWSVSVRGTVDGEPVAADWTIVVPESQAPIALSDLPEVDSKTLTATAPAAWAVALEQALDLLAQKAQKDTIVYYAADHGVVGDWTGGATGSGTNDTAALQALIDLVPEGAQIRLDGSKTYRLDSLTSSKTVHLDFADCGVVSRPWTAYSPFVRMAGTTGAARLIAATTAGSMTVTLSTPSQAAEFAAGTFASIHDNKPLYEYDGTQSVHVGRGEVLRVKASDPATGTVTFSKPVEWDYGVSPTLAPITKMLTEPSVRNIGKLTEIDPGQAVADFTPTVLPHIIQFQYAHRPKVRNVYVDGFNVHAVNVTQCLGYDVADVTATNPFRPDVGGHGYGVRSHTCTRGRVARFTGFGLRHVVDWVLSYDCISEQNTSWGAVVSPFQTHGIWSKRIRSIDDSAYASSSTGWTVGNPAFGPDYGVKIIRPTYRGSSAAVTACDGSTDVDVVDPDFETTAAVAVGIYRAATRVRIKDGTIAMPGTEASGRAAVLARSRPAADGGYLLAGEVGDVSVIGTRLTGATAVVDISAKGRVVVDDVSFDGVSASAVAGLGLVQVGMTETATQPSDITVRRLRASGSTYNYGARVYGAPAGAYVVSENALTDHGVPSGGITAPVAPNMRCTFNRLKASSNGSTPLALSGDVAAARAAGAVIRDNFPSNYDELPGLSTRSTTLTGSTAASFTIDVNDPYEIYNVNAASQPVTVILKNTSTPDRKITIRKSDTSVNLVTIMTESGVAIENLGAVFYLAASYDQQLVISTSTLGSWRNGGGGRMRHVRTSNTARNSTNRLVASATLDGRSSTLNFCDATALTAPQSIVLPITAETAGFDFNLVKIDAVQPTVVSTAAGGSIDGVVGATLTLTKPGERIYLSSRAAGDWWVTSSSIGQPDQASTVAGVKARQRSLVAGQWYLLGDGHAVGSSSAVGIGTLKVYPFVVEVATTIDQLSINVATGQAGAAFRAGIYADDGTGYPGALILDAGALDASAAGQPAAGSTKVLQPGIYWRGGAVQASGTQPTLSTLSGFVPPIALRLGTAAPSTVTAFGYQMSGVTGALPATFATTVSTTGTIPRVALRAA